MRRTKRWLAFLLSFSMVLGTGASPVFAAPSRDAQTAVESTVSAGTEAEGSAVYGSEEAAKNQTADGEAGAGIENAGTTVGTGEAETAAGIIETEAENPSAVQSGETNSEAAAAEPKTQDGENEAAETHTLLAAVKENSYVFGGTPEFDENGEATVFAKCSTNMLAKLGLVPADGVDGSGLTVTYTYLHASTSKELTRTTTTPEKDTPVVGLVKRGIVGNTVQVTVVSGEGLTEHYTIHVERTATLSGLSATYGDGISLDLSPAFAENVGNYTLNVTEDVTSVKMTAKESNGIAGTEILFNGTASADGTCEVPLESGENKVTVQAKNDAKGSYLYTITIYRMVPARLTVDLKTEGALFALYRGENASERIFPETDGTYKMLRGEAYTYTVTAKGYKSYQAPEAERDSKGRNVLRITEDTTKTFTLEKAPESEELPQYTPTYPGARCGKDNNSIVNVKTPINKNAVEVVWERQTGEAVTPSSGTTPIIVGDFLYTFSRDTIYKIDKETGEVVGSAATKPQVGFNLIPVTYGDGMLFVPIRHGVQCFNAETLESIWVYTDSNGNGAVNNPIRYEDGYIYFGLQGTGVLTCISVDDEDPTSGDEAKDASWKNMDSNGNIWWNDVWTNERYVFVAAAGPENQKNDGGRLLCINKITGETVQSVAVDGGRSGVAYYNKRIYFTSRTGKIYSFNLDSEGKLDLEHLITPLDLGGVSTSTPVIHNNRLYIGWSGRSNVGSGGAGLRVIRIDPETGTMTEAYAVPTKAYCQTSGVISTAYEESTGYVYVYFMENSPKGSLYMIKDSADMTEADPESGVLYNPNHSQFCIASVAVDEKGTLYMKNDSAWQFAIRSSDAYIDGIEVTGGNAELDGGREFNASVNSHTLLVDPGTESLQMTLTVNSGTTISVNGKAAASGEPIPVDLNGNETIDVQLTNGETVRTYTFTIKTEPIVTRISVSNSAVYGGGTSYTWDKEFTRDITDYTVGTKAVGDKAAYIWVIQYGLNDTVEVVSYDGLASEPVITYNENLDSYYVTCSFAETTKGTTADITLKACSGTRSKLYHLKLYTGDVLPLPEISGAAVRSRTETTAAITYTASKNAKVYYLAADSDAEAPDAAAIVSGKKSVNASAGENVLTLSELEKTDHKVVYLVMYDLAEVYSDVIKVEIPAYQMLGDLDGNESITLTDAIKLLDLVTAGEAVSPLVGDINGDGEVNLTDAVALLDQVTGSL